MLNLLQERLQLMGANVATAAVFGGMSIVMCLLILEGNDPKTFMMDILIKGLHVRCRSDRMLSVRRERHVFHIDCRQLLQFTET